ncbi:MAG: AraC family transcriptional regulator [Azospirillaceae bacterium]|nr:AraC family transcriptional regulator [Azospirillaceae bacterium]
MLDPLAGKTTKVVTTDDALCSFVRRALPPGQPFEMKNVFHEKVVILAFRGSIWESKQGGRAYEETPGCVVFRDAGQVFSTRTLMCDEKIGSDCHEIHIDRTVMEDLLNDHPSGRRKFDFSRPVFRNEGIHRRIIHTQSVFENRECALMRSTCLAVLLADIAAANTDESSARRDSRTSRRHHAVIEYMRENFDQEIRLQELANIANLNQFVLLRQFRDDYGVTPHQYLRTFRVNQAMKYIAQGMKLADVAQSCGFFDQSHLNRQFKQTVGVSPGKYFRLSVD